MSAKEAFFATLHNEWYPLLRHSGFKGSGQRFQRENNEVIHAIGVQVNKYGGSCCVNLGIHLRFLPLSNNQMLASGQKIRVESCEFRWRLAPPGHTDYWWGFESGVKAHLPLSFLDQKQQGPVKQARHLIETYTAYGEPYLQSLMTVVDIAGTIRVEDIGRNELKSPIYAFAAGRAGLTMARIHKYLGNIEMARQFAETGLQHVGKARQVQEALEKLLEEL